MSDGASTSSASSSNAGVSAGQGGNANAAASNTGQATQGNEGAAVASEGTKQAESKPVEAKETAVQTETNEPETKQEIKEHKLQQKLREKFKDKKFEKPEDFFDAADQELSEHEQYKEENIKQNKQLWDLFQQHPTIGDILQDMAKGADFKEALARNVDLANIEPYDDEPDYDKWTKAKNERVTKQKEKENLQKEWDTNFAQSVKEFESFAKELNYDKAKATEFTGKIDSVINELNKGIVSKKFLNMMRDHFEFKDAVKEAAEQAEIKGRNENIEAKKENVKEKIGDGMPDINISGKSENLDKPKVESKKDVWSMGIERQLAREKAAAGETQKKVTIKQ